MTIAEAGSARGYVETEVAERAFHDSAEDVRTTCSFARAERLLGREYHGRFLIELLQNAADASRGVDTASGRSRVVVQITEGPALLVANEGAPMSAEVLIQSLGHIGASTKAEGEAIGHKGIGFKSVLELTLAPEIYSGLQQSSPALAVGFDPERALEKIRSDSTGWDDWVSGVQGLDPEDPLAAVPVLRFPHWIEDLPMEVAELKQGGFDTVVRLPFAKRFTERLNLDEDGWLQTVRGACDNVSDQILLLLGCFDEVRLEDRLDPSRDVAISPEGDPKPARVVEGATREVVRVRRNGKPSSRWRLYRRDVLDRKGLEGEIAVGIRVDDGAQDTVLPAVDGHPSSPFHLFFPTRIPSGLPFLLHAYFEVDAARTGFYRGSAERNGAMLDELAGLAKVAVADAARDKGVDLVSLANLVAEAGEPEDELARKFRGDVLSLLDDVEWVALRAGDGLPRSDIPANVFVARSDLIRRIGAAFPPSYIRKRTGLGLPDGGLREEALDLVLNRSGFSEFWETVEELCLPGDQPPWRGSSADEGFRCLVDLYVALESEDRQAAQSLLGRLRGNLDSRLLPTVGEEDSRVLLPIPNPRERGERGRLVMARGGRPQGSPLVPPEHLNVAFLPDGLLASDTDAGESNRLTINQAYPLGVRPYGADDVLDRLITVEFAELGTEKLEETVSFLWRVLARARNSALGTKTAEEEAASFDPSRWFWCRPSSVWQDASARPRQQRERHLSSVPLPCRDGGWRPAGRTAFGADWAEWIRERAEGEPTRADRARIEAYEALERIAPAKGELLAPPAEVLGLLVEDAFHGTSRADADGDDEAFVEAQRDRERHAFLLRLGVWEVPPIEAFQNATLGNRETFPWKGDALVRQQKRIENGGGWGFDLHGGYVHNNVYLAEDYRFLWPLEGMARKDGPSLVKCLRLGAKLYGERSHALVFCPGCSYGASHHRTRRTSSGADGYPSQLAVQLRSDPWVPCTLAGRPVEGGTRPGSAWWLRTPPSGAGLRQSPWSLVPLCGPDVGVDDDLRRLAGIQYIDDAPPEAVERLLREIRQRFEEGRLPDDPRALGNARQAFVGLHRQAYERLSGLQDKTLARGVLGRTGVLCEVGQKLEYRVPDEAWHDDGSYATYVRHFEGRVPFAVLQRDKTVAADHLGIPRFRLELNRRGEDEGRDVTDEVRGFVGDRAHELLSIMVHYSLGGQTLDPHGEEFELRARRISNLEVRQLDDLIIDIGVPGSNLRHTIGEGSGRNLFLEGETTRSPVLFHDFSGEGWEGRLRRKISPHLARVLRNPAYVHTFAQLLRGDEDEREEFLRELGISQEETDAVRSHAGVVGEEELLLQRRWFAAILGAEDAALLDLDHDELTRRLVGTGLSAEQAGRLVELGGGREVRRDADDAGALRFLDDAGFDFRELHSRLRSMGDPGLEIGVSRNRFFGWLDENRLRLQVVLETNGRSRSSEAAKEALRGLRPPPDLALSLDPELPALLYPVAASLREEGLGTDDMHLSEHLAEDPVGTLAGLAGVETDEELDARVESRLDDRERARFLGERAVRWRNEIRLLAVLLGTGPNETRANIRALDEHVDNELPGAPATPLELRGYVATHFDVDLAERINADLLATLDAPAPDRERLIGWAGIGLNQLERVRNALDGPRRERARRLERDRERLRQGKISPVTPVGLQPPQTKKDEAKPKPRLGRTTVKAAKVDERYDRRKRELGDEGERWALAAIIEALMGLDDDARNAAIDEMKALLTERFTGSPVDKAVVHAESARLRNLDDEERIEELSGFLHVSRYSDAFGFDLIGWLPSGGAREGHAVCLEVKSSGSESFHLSRKEWSIAEKLHFDGVGDWYAVLVVRRARAGGVPAAMDLLSDPVALVNAGHLLREADGYQIAYRASG